MDNSTTDLSAEPADVNFAAIVRQILALNPEVDGFRHPDSSCRCTRENPLKCGEVLLDCRAHSWGCADHGTLRDLVTQNMAGLGLSRCWIKTAAGHCSRSRRELRNGACTGNTCCVATWHDYASEANP